MDENGDGAISYDEWLNFFLKVKFLEIICQSYTTIAIYNTMIVSILTN